jgi:hypothetical protein
MYIRKTTQFKIDGRSKLVITYNSSDKKGMKDRTFKIQEGNRGPYVTWVCCSKGLERASNDAVIQRHCDIGGKDMTGEVIQFISDNAPTGWID